MKLKFVFELIFFDYEVESPHFEVWISGCLRD